MRVTTTTTEDLNETTRRAEPIEPTVVRPGETEGYWLAGDLIEPLLSGGRTRGAFDVFRGTVPPRGGPPPHIHRREDELMYVVAGEFEFTAGEHVSGGGPGTCVFLPRNVVHQFRNVGATAGTLVTIATPTGFLDFTRDGGAPATNRTTAPPLDEAGFSKLAAACINHHIDLLPTWCASKPAASRRPVRELTVLGLGVRILMTSDDTRNQVTLAEVIATRRGDGVPAHRHHRENEIFYVLDGTFVFELPHRTVTATPGTFVHVPRMTTHAFYNVGDAPARLLDAYTPSGFEDFFIEAGATELRDPAQVIAMMRKHGMDVPAPTGA